MVTDLAPIDLMIQNGRCPRACRQSRPACWTITDALQLFVLAILRNTAPPPQKGSARGKPAVVRCPATVGLPAPRRGKDTRARSPPLPLAGYRARSSAASSGKLPNGTDRLTPCRSSGYGRLMVSRVDA
jgi:hypothetical protein